MITVNTISKQIKTCKGDSFYTYFQIKGYKIKGDETITLSIRKDFSDSSEVLVTHKCDIDERNNIILAYIPKEKMSILNVGEYYYDIVMNRTDGFHISLVNASKIFVLGVAHSD